MVPLSYHMQLGSFCRIHKVDKEKRVTRVNISVVNLRLGWMQSVLTKKLIVE